MHRRVLIICAVLAANLVRFYGHMGRKRSSAGRYVLYARAHDSANQRSALRSVRFIVTR